MTQQKINTEELYRSYDECATAMMEQLDQLNDTQLNTIPFEGNWTAGQVMEHVTKSNTGIAKALNIDGIPVNRNADAREPELRELFLDFSIKFQSPDFILPTKDHYEKKQVEEDFSNSLSLLKKIGDHVNLEDAIKHPAFGEITKLELLCFVKFHLQRHLLQLKKIGLGLQAQ